MPHKLTTAAAVAVFGLGSVAVAFGPPVSAHEAGDPVLVDDLNSTGASAVFLELHPLGADVYFVADTPETGVELFFHDTSSDTTTLVDLNPGPADSDPQSLTTGPDGAVYFAADDGVHGRELWRVDDGEAELVKDIRPGTDGSRPRALVVFDAMVYFAADDGTFNDAYPSGAELWRSDGTFGGTVRVPMDDDVTGLWELAVFEGAVEDRLFFSGHGVTTDNGNELWRYTASTAAVVEYDIVGGANNSWPAVMTQAGTRLFLRADARLQRIDNPEGAPAWTPLALHNPSEIVASDDTVWLRGLSQANPGRYVLWRVIGAGAPTEFLTAIDPQEIAMYSSTPIYSATGPNGREFWAQTSEDTDIVPGPDSGSPAGITPVTSGGRAVMWANRYGLHQIGWIATGGGVKPFNPYPGLDPLPLNQPALDPEPDPVGGGWWHIGNDVEHGVSLWHLSADGSTTSRAPSTDVAPGTAGSFASAFVPFGDDVAFFATDGMTTLQPWLYDPAVGTTTRLAGPAPADDASQPVGLTAAANRLFFRASRANGGERELWVADGIPGNTHRVSDTAGDPTFTYGFRHAAFKNGVLFDGETIDGSPSADIEPWFSDGTPAGTFLLADVNVGPGPSYPNHFTALGGLAVFAAAQDLWVTDGTPAGTALLADTDVDFVGSVVVDVVGESVAYFISQADGVWRTDGTPAGTFNVALDDNPMVIPTLSTIAAAGNWVYVTGSQTWAIDTTTNVATQVATPSGFLAWFDDAASVGPTVVFPGAVPAGAGHTESVYALTAATLTALPVSPGNFYDEDVPLSFTTHHEYVYFTGVRSATGREIWRTDGTLEGTTMLRELIPGPVSAEPSHMSAIGDRLYFTADLDGLGAEPHYIELEPTVIVPVDPARYWDTRVGEQTFDHLHEATGRLLARTPYRLDIAGRGGVPSGAQAVAANIAVILPDGAGWANLYPCTPEVPTASHLNYVGGNVLANAAIVPLDDQGDVCIYSTQAADFILDVNGYVDPYAPALGIEPARYLDTRTGEGHTTFDGLLQGTGAVAAETFVEVPIRGRGAVPANATAAIVNVTAVTPADHGYFTLWSCGDPRPVASTVNYTPSDIVPNGAVIELSGDGSICIFSKASSEVVLDVTGYLTADMATVHTMTPARLFDSRAGNPIVDGTATGPRLAAEQTIEIQIAGRGGVPARSSAAFFNVAAIGTEGPGYVTLWPCNDPSRPRPLASNVNYTPGMTRANNALVKLSPDGTICAFTKAGADLILDVTGWID